MPQSGCLRVPCTEGRTDLAGIAGALVDGEAVPVGRCPIATLRARLTDLRDDLRQRLGAAEVFDGGLLAILANTETVLAALDRDA
jgi:hypothetical protein